MSGKKNIFPLCDIKKRKRADNNNLHANPQL